MLIYETDKDLYWRWTGAAFVRAWPLGWLGGSRRTTALSVATTTLTTLVSVAVSVPAGGRRVAVYTSYSGIENTAGSARLAIYRDSTPLVAWNVDADSDSGVGSDFEFGGSFPYFEAPGEGSFTYSLRMAATTTYGGTSYCQATASEPTSIDVVEV
jgi:hypothetical protein